MSAVLDPTGGVPAGDAIAEYNPVETGLADLRKRYGGVVYDLTNREEDKACRTARAECVQLRGRLETTRKRLKEPALRYSQLIDSEARRINTEIAKVEMGLDEQIRADEARREEERQRKANAAAAKRKAIQARIDQIRAIAARAVGKSAANIEEKVKLVVSQPIDALYGELIEEARQAKAETLTALRTMHANAVAHETQQRQLSEQIAEQQRLDAEAATRRRLEDEQAANARRAADEQAARERAEADRVAREQREAEQQRIDNERVIEATQRRAAELKEQAAQTRLHDAAPLMLRTLRMVEASDVWDSFGPVLQDAVGHAIEAATGEVRKAVHG